MFKSKPNSKSGTRFETCYTTGQFGTQHENENSCVDDMIYDLVRNRVVATLCVDVIEIPTTNDEDAASNVGH